MVIDEQTDNRYGRKCPNKYGRNRAGKPNDPHNRNAQVSQPLPFSEEGETVTVPRTQIEIDEDEDKRLSVLSNSVTLQELVDGLNALGIGPRDMISILQAIKAAGALQAEIELL